MLRRHPLTLSDINQYPAEAEVLHFRSPQDIRWDALGAADAPYVREALLEAEARRDNPGAAGELPGEPDSGDSYLEVFSILRLSA